MGSGVFDRVLCPNDVDPAVVYSDVVISAGRLMCQGFFGMSLVDRLMGAYGDRISVLTGDGRAKVLGLIKRFGVAENHIE